MLLSKARVQMNKYRGKIQVIAEKIDAAKCFSVPD